MNPALVLGGLGAMAWGAAALPAALAGMRNTTVVSIQAPPVRLKGDHPRPRRILVKYLLLINQGTALSDWTTLPDDERQAIAADYQAIRETPGVTPGVGMQPPETATTVRVQDGQTLVTDGPFVETKEALGGFMTYEADDLDAAIELAARVPAVRFGGAVEIRPVAEW